MPAKTNDKVKEILRLYSKKKWTLEEIGAHFGVTKQAIHDRLTRAKIKLPFIKRDKRPRTVLDRDTLIQLYEVEKQSVAQIIDSLKTTRYIINKELVRYGIAKRPPNLLRRKHPELYEIKVGDRTIIESLIVKNPYRNLHGKAFKAGMKISVKRIDAETFEVTRIK